MIPDENFELKSDSGQDGFSPPTPGEDQVLLVAVETGHPPQENIGHHDVVLEGLQQRELLGSTDSRNTWRTELK